MSCLALRRCRSKEMMQPCLLYLHLISLVALWVQVMFDLFGFSGDGCETLPLRCLSVLHSRLRNRIFFAYIPLHSWPRQCLRRVCISCLRD